MGGGLELRRARIASLMHFTYLVCVPDAYSWIADAYSSERGLSAEMAILFSETASRHIVTSNIIEI